MQRVRTTATVIAHTGRLPTHFFVPSVSAYIWQNMVIWYTVFWNLLHAAITKTLSPTPEKTEAQSYAEKKKNQNTFFVFLSSC